ncbi:MAG: hypothetical protein N2Z72_00350 [Bacteroidales bacterium]|nr:hypothetical protein [Bacteroidales bacterium]
MRIAFLVILSVLLLIGCRKKDNTREVSDHPATEEKIEATPLIIGYTTESYDIARVLAQEFSFIHPDKTIRLQEINSEKIDSILKITVFDAVFSSFELDTLFIYKNLVNEIYLFALNFDNPVLPRLVQTGIDLQTLKKVLSSYEIRNWNQILKDVPSQSLQVFVPPQNHPVNILLHKYFQVRIHSHHIVPSYDQVKQNLSVSKGGLACISLRDVYDLRSGLRKKGIYPLFLDLNDDQFLSDDELFYDQINHLKKAYLRGKYPEGFALKHYVYFQKTQTKKELMEFMKFVNENALNLLEPRGYVKPK